MLLEQENLHNKNEQRTDLLPDKHAPFQNIVIDAYKEGLLFAVGNALTLYVISTLVTLILFWMEGIDKKSAVAFITYSLLLVFLVLIIKNDIKRFIPKFLNWTPYVVGVAFGLAIMGFDEIYIRFINLFYPLHTGGNQQGIEQIVARFPVISIFIFGLVGPMCEELTYRVGMFNFIKRWKRVWAYVITGLLFGLIHLDYKGDLAVEFLLLPSYIAPGVLLAAAYDLYDLPCSFTAHITNNLIVLIQLAVRLHS